jgi:hypothetical protein
MGVGHAMNFAERKEAAVGGVGKGGKRESGGCVCVFQ